MKQCISYDFIRNGNAKFGELLDVRVYFLISVKLIVIVCTEVLKLGATKAVLKNKVYKLDKNFLRNNSIIPLSMK
jgi:hypothetical protein